jgi:thiamine pyrophosphate-dependent acetolactate synthase large subunit-like protein
MAFMACALPYAIAVAIAFPERQVVAAVGDDGLSMLVDELATCVRYRLPIKIFVMKNNILGQIKWLPTAPRHCRGAAASRPRFRRGFCRSE